MNSGIDIGDTIGGYRITSLIGTGGMGRVYEVEHTVTKRVEAMKLLLPSAEGTAPEDQQEHVSRFLREIQVQASLSHPNIAGVHNAFVEDGLLVMVMELARGSSLKRVLEVDRPTLEKSVDYICQVLQALEYAHRRGVIHRDITPANIIVTPDGTVKLTDFGLAKSQKDVQITRDGIAVGSVHYMSPEQVRGQQELDYRSDLYSTGAVLYELVTRQKVFDATDGFAIMRAHVERQPVPPAQHNRECPQLLNDVIIKALSKDPIQRFRGAAEFRAALERVKVELERSKSAPKSATVTQITRTTIRTTSLNAYKRKRRMGTVVAIGVAGMAAAAVAYFATQKVVSNPLTEAAEVSPVKKQAPKRYGAKKSAPKRAAPATPAEDSTEWANPR